MEYKNKYDHWLGVASDKEIRAQLLRLSDSEIEEAFFSDLVFGTGGIRAIMGAGTSRLNIYTIIKIAQGTASYLIAKKSQQYIETIDNHSDRDCRILKCKDETVLNKEDECGMKVAAVLNKKGECGIKAVISYDNRNNSQRFARICAAVLAENGIEVMLSKTCNPTPYLSFSVRHFGADAGIMITASHNPKEYNGYKLYDSSGCQLTDDDSKAVSDFIAIADPFPLKLKPLSHYISGGLITITSCTNGYLNAVKNSVKKRVFEAENQASGVLKEGINQHGIFFNLNASAAQSPNKGEIRVVYTPLCGTGGVLTPKILAKTAKVFTVDSQLKPDGNFTLCDVPNPENPLAYSRALECAKANNADLIIATDPDADRMGVMVFDGYDLQNNAQNSNNTYGYKFLSGNQIGVLLSYFLLSENVKHEGMDSFIENPLIVSTVVSTSMIDKIAAVFDAEIKRVLTGFKYIGETINRLEKIGKQNRFLLGFEDSHGFLCGDYVRDKDGLQAALLITKFAKILKAEGHTLLDVLDALYRRFGYYRHKTLSFRFSGTLGDKKIKEIMNRLREGGLSGLAGAKTIDYIGGYNGLYSADMLELVTDNGSIIVRPSGTEPLLKVYLTSTAPTFSAAEGVLKEYEDICNAFF